jgi:hypothetical protein
MLKLANRAKMSTATTGTGAITLGSAASGFQSFADAGVVNGDVVRYVIEDGTAWEIGQGTYTASGTTLSRTVLESSNSDTAISLSGSATVLITAAAEDVAQVKIDTYTTAGSTTWTKPSWAKMVKVIAIGGGAGGGSGGRYATSSARCGGGAGGGGGTVSFICPASFLGSTETVIVGSGGQGGASQGTDTSPGNDGLDGGKSSFGSIISAGFGTKGSGGASSSNSNGGGSVSITTMDSLVGGGGSLGRGGVVGTVITVGPATSTGGGGGAGGGAGSTTGYSGTDAGYVRVATAPNTTGLVYSDLLGGSAGTSGGNGSAGSSYDFADRKIGTGGGGGSYATGQATGAGGNGAQPGGGGGGGAASDNGYASGAGGNGGDGWVRVISWA